MTGQMLKLKQASAVLRVAPKELQNLVQFGVVKPKRTEGTNCFDVGTLLVAKVAFYRKESLGTRTSVLSKLMKAFSASKRSSRPRIRARLYALAESLQKSTGTCHAAESARMWKKGFLESLAEAARDIGEVSDEEILRTVRSYRRERRTPEITVASVRQRLFNLAKKDASAL